MLVGSLAARWCSRMSREDRYLCCYLCDRATGKRDPYDHATAKREWQKEVQDA